MRIEIKRLSDCPLNDGVEAYNRGFEGYFYDQTKDIDSFSKRFGLDELCPEYSVLAYYEGRPAGIVLSGIKNINGKLVAWNGGTGVAKELRGKGAGKKLMNAVMDIYRENKVETATLEAISRNEGAIELYKKIGYDVKKRLKFLQFNEVLYAEVFDTPNSKYQIEYVSPQELTGIPFYQHQSPWQNQNLHDASAIVLHDEHNQIAGYSLYKKMYKEGEIASIGLLQLEAAENRSDSADIIKTLLKHSFFPLNRAFQRTTVNTPDDKTQLLEVLQECGFKEWEEQVWMVKDLGAEKA
ncbi:GNAT family N-acetyltransferase [Heyndrickxia sp. MSNUG]|uniref:GNAT family N-acetyltransferase n=1 Tax=Heyndrickxia sp. MSNUG TaxID=3136677 RepID=UPI003C2CF855